MSSSPFFLFSEIVRTIRRLSVVGGLGVLLGSAACSSSAMRELEPSPPTGTVRIGVPEGETQSGDVGFQQQWRFFTQDPFTTRGPDGRPQGRVAESWEVSADGLTWEIHLRPNVTFHDGTALDAEAAKQVLDAVLARASTRASSPGLAEVREVATAGLHTLVISLARRSAFLMEELDIPLTKKGPGGTVIGTGPFKPVTISPREVVLQAHEGYHLGSPAVHELIVKFYPTLRLAWASLLRGEIDAVSNVSAAALEFVRAGVRDLSGHRAGSRFRPRGGRVRRGGELPGDDRSKARRALQVPLEG